jgi:hypothetical protein
MLGRLANQLPPFSRRALLFRVVTTVGAAALFSVAAGDANGQPKISKKAVAYQDHPEGDRRCDKCIQFQPPDGCKIVDGQISPQGCCRIFVLAQR